MKFHIWKEQMKRMNVLSTLITMLFLAGCASIPKDYARTSSTAFEDHTSTTIGQMFDEEAARHQGMSGFDIIRYGRQAFTARIAMTEMAEKSLDLQYYAWETDSTGRLLAYYALKAADRGVKVRILLDDIGLEGRDGMIAALNAHPDIEIRIFNPFAHRDMHGLSFLSNFDHVNHRMHNKTFLIDNTLVIIGGRNLGDHYFDVSDDVNFRDLDIAAAGPIVREVSHVYDYFWNGTWAVPIKVLVDKPYSQEDMQKARAELAEKIANDHYPYPLSKDISKIRSQMLAIRDKLFWAPGKFVWNDPKQMKLSQDEQHGTMIQKFIEKLRKV